MRDHEPVVRMSERSLRRIHNEDAVGLYEKDKVQAGWPLSLIN